MTKGSCSSGPALCERTKRVMPAERRMTTDNRGDLNSVEIEDLVQARSQALAMRNRVHTILSASSQSRPLSEDA